MSTFFQNLTYLHIQYIVAYPLYSGRNFDRFSYLPLPHNLFFEILVFDYYYYWYDDYNYLGEDMTSICFILCFPTFLPQTSIATIENLSTVTFLWITDNAVLG